ncbi:MAG: LytTR family DNA-binding domain-containing protein [Bacteroidota bacterium]
MSDLLKILIVDDEPEARELLKFILQDMEGVRVVGMAGDVDDAVKLLNEELPDLVFLDIQMPGKDGFQFIDLVKGNNHKPGIIFVTAFDSYAIQAIRNSVFDYIMKPVRQNELIDAVQRYRKNRVMGENQEFSQLVSVLKRTESVKVKLNTRSGYILIHPPEIVYCKADGNYTTIQISNGTNEVTTQNLGTIEELLKSGTFFRVSRSYLVNLKYLARVDRKSNLCFLEYNGDTASIKIPAQKVKMLESNFN